MKYTEQDLKLYAKNHDEFMSQRAILRLAVKCDMSETQEQFYMTNFSKFRGDKFIEEIDRLQVLHDDQYVGSTGLSYFEIDPIEYCEWIEFFDPETEKWTGVTF